MQKWKIPWKISPESSFQINFSLAVGFSKSISEKISKGNFGEISKGTNGRFHKKFWKISEVYQDELKKIKGRNL